MRPLASTDGPQVETRPCKNIHFIQDDPGALAIEAQVLFDAQRNFNCDIQVLRQRVSDWDNSNLLASIKLWTWMIDRKDNGAGPILPSLDQPPFLFFLPEI